MNHPTGAKRAVYNDGLDHGTPRFVTTERGPGYLPLTNQTISTPLGYIPQVNSTYAYWDNSYGMQNEVQLSISESTCAAKTVGYPLDHWPQLAEHKHKLSRIALQRCDTSACAVKTMGALAEQSTDSTANTRTILRNQATAQFRGVDHRQQEPPCVDLPPNLQTTYNHHMSDEAVSDGFRIRLLAAQRDMYISGICLFLNLLLQMLYSSMVVNIKLEKSLGAMEKQAKGASSSYTNLLEEHEILQKQLKKLVGLDGTTDLTSLEKLLKENAAYETEVASLKKSVAASDAAIAQVKKQADSQSAAYMKLLDETTAKSDQAQEIKDLHAQVVDLKQTVNDLTKDRDSLKTQIQDYDFMFAEAKKKAE
ncbi:hypothetical protein DYB25_001207 [Aphanomyces astaci]|uniref:BAP29/BAP31 transmembrane domain-containing protein n=1 Tax=Aphanomyces astaci TaxID=112090 RepID=A0A397ACA5_APHAT|nr:hypothetical protein DYB25_001207 [Aphanomyces astaci]